jgi:hypothetical protein
MSRVAIVSTIGGKSGDSQGLDGQLFLMGKMYLLISGSVYKYE